MSTDPKAFENALTWATGMRATHDDDQMLVCWGAVRFTQNALAQNGYHDAARDCASLGVAINRVRAKARSIEEDKL